MNSRDKGKRGERELAQFLKRHGWDARRGQQFSGGNGSPDIVHNIPNLHIEVKRVEKLRLWPAVEQAAGDAGAMDWSVWHRSSYRPWVVICDAEHYLGLRKQQRGLVKLHRAIVREVVRV